MICFSIWKAETERYRNYGFAMVFIIRKAERPNCLRSMYVT